MDKLKPQKKSYASLIVKLIILGVLLIGVFFSIKSQRGEATVSETWKTVYRAKEDLKDIAITDENISQYFYAEQVAPDIAPSNAAVNLIGMTITVSQNEIVTTDMLTPTKVNESVPDDLRYVEFTFSTIPTTIDLTGKLVDIVSFNPQVQDDVVISKSCILNINGNNVGMQLTNLETERLTEATSAGNQLYFRVYINESQSASPVTFNIQGAWPNE